jgi:hypothetical protein
LSYVADRKDFARHEAEIVAHESFDYAIFEPAEAELLGCVYIDPARRPVAAAHRGGGVVVHAPFGPPQLRGRAVAYDSGVRPFR